VAEIESLGSTAQRTLEPRVSPGPVGAGRPVPPAGAPAEDPSVMSLVDHLTELRRRLIISGLAVVAGTVVGFFLTPGLIGLLKAPIPGALVFTTLGGAFFLQLKLALLVGIALAFPVVLYQLWAFVAPGLTARERRAARPWIPLALLFFVLGIAVAYIALPFTAAFLLSFEIEGVIEPLITAEEYFSFVTLMFLAFGVVMQFPILLVLLSKLGILSVERLRRSRRYVLLGMVIVAVVITPGGDPVSPALMTAVMYVLYEVSILILSRSASREGAADG
jgi:sec-independent protein translocase protein TatC